MELKHYLYILRRQWIPLAMVPILVGVFVVMQMVGGEPSHTATAQMTVTRAPQPIDMAIGFNEYYLILSSEFIIDDLVEVVRGNVFAQDVHERLLQEHGIDISAGEVQASISSDRQHRILTIDVTNSNPDRAVLIARAATEQLNESSTKYFGFDQPDRDALVEPIQIAEHAGPASSQDQIFWALQLLVAVFAGVLLAFLFDYLDDRLHSTEMVENALGLDVIAEVPRGEVS